MPTKTPKEHSSWAEMVQDYRHEKVSLGWKPKELPPRKVITKFQKTREERVFDPILQNFRDKSTESTRRETEKMFATATLNKARETRLATGQPYDIINHGHLVKPKQKKVVKQDPETLRKLQLRRSHVDYNVVSNIPLSKHHFAHPKDRPPSKEEKTSSLSVPRKRDYDILSGRYLNRHNARKNKDVRAQKDRAAKLFWQTHDFNPVSCTFYDRDKEEAFVRVRQAFEDTHGEVQNAKLPPRIRLAEGNLYNIMTMEPKNKEELMHYDYKNDNKFNSTKDAMERDIRKRCENKYDLGETRKLNRVAAKRFEEMTANGFDLVTGQSFYGKKAKPLYRPSYMQKPPTVWDRVEVTKSANEKLASTLGSTLGSTLAMTGAMSMNNTYSPSPAAVQETQPLEQSRNSKNPTPAPEQDVSFINIPSAREEKTYKEVSHELVPKLELSKSTGNINNQSSVKKPESSTSNNNKVRTGGF